MKKTFSLLFSTILYLLSKTPVQAQHILESTLKNTHNTIAPNIDFDTDLAGLFTGGKLNLLELVFFFIGLLFFSSFIIASYSYITAGGNAQSIQAATKRITNSLLGLGMVIVSYVIVKIIGTMIGMPNII
jgi:hypothetical protein